MILWSGLKSRAVTQIKAILYNECFCKTYVFQGISSDRMYSQRCMSNRTVPTPGADKGFLERGFLGIKLWGFALIMLSYCSYISHEIEIIWSQ